jgi:hypothetical protein
MTGHATLRTKWVWKTSTLLEIDSTIKNKNCMSYWQQEIKEFVSGHHARQSNEKNVSCA